MSTFVKKDFKAIYESKLVDVKTAVASIQDGDVVCTGGPANEPGTFLKNLTYLKELGRKNVTISHVSGQVRGEFADFYGDVDDVRGFPRKEGEYRKDFDYITDPSMKDTMTVNAVFFNRSFKKAMPKGVCRYMPYQVFVGTKPYDKGDVFVVTTTPVDEHGYVRMSCGAMGELPVMRSCKRIICEINPNYPYTFGDVAIPIEDVDMCFIGDGKMVIYPNIDVADVEKTIGQNVASLIPDGSTIQLGFGGIPNAVAYELTNKNDLGVHSEMFTENMAHLEEMGVITGKRKTINPNKMLATFAMGTQYLYDYINNNAKLELRSGEYVNDPAVIRQHDNMMSVNTCIELDLGGQICSESFGPVQYSGSGGAMNFAQGAYWSKGGKCIFALRSTAKKGEVSTIKPILTPGAVVTVPRVFINYVVTEYGIAELTNANMTERAERLIAIAHPKFRDELKAQAIEMGICAW
ncbi:MAG: 4-hydroxybutyrate--acetyl-CoA CoA transferase [Oscillospiraceae bacterium]|nr:4-hydroxybutyrate--acetyl-CoA CoA transferase [Oscillospiraceae bacterium]